MHAASIDPMTNSSLTVKSPFFGTISHWTGVIDGGAFATIVVAGKAAAGAGVKVHLFVSVVTDCPLEVVTDVSVSVFLCVGVAAGEKAVVDS